MKGICFYNLNFFFGLGSFFFFLVPVFFLFPKYNFEILPLPGSYCCCREDEFFPGKEEHEGGHNPTRWDFVVRIRYASLDWSGFISSSMWFAAHWLLLKLLTPSVRAMVRTFVFLQGYQTRLCLPQFTWWNCIKKWNESFDIGPPVFLFSLAYRTYFALLNGIVVRFLLSFLRVVHHRMGHNKIYYLSCHKLGSSLWFF